VSVQATCRRLISRGDLPGSNGGIYNPGCFRAGTSIVLLCRREIDYRGTALAFPELIVLDPNTLNVVRHRTLLKVGYSVDDRVEDFRCIDFNGMHLAVHSLVRSDRIRPVIARVLPDALTREDDLQLPIDVGRVEKNWVLFVHESALHCLYRLDPLTIFRQGSDRSWQLVKAEHNGWADGIERTLSNSTNLIPFEEGYLGFWHTQLAGRYVQGAYFLDRHLTIRYHTGILLDGAWVRGIKPGVLYVESLLEQDGQVLAFYGEGDAHTGVAMFDHDELWRELQGSPLTPSNTIQLGYEGSSMRDAFVAIQTLQRFAAEHGHPRIRLFLPDAQLRPMFEVVRIPNIVIREGRPPAPHGILVRSTVQLVQSGN
jgi:hypothetical protein